MSIRLRLPFAAALVLAVVSAASAEPQLRVVTDNEKRPVAVELTDVFDQDRIKLEKLPTTAPAWHALKVYVLNDQGVLQEPAVAGRCELIERTFRFTPQFPFSPATKYYARIIVPFTEELFGSFARLDLSFEVPPLPRAEPTKVTANYPSADTLPENQLRFYIHFSAPMAAGEAYSHIKLLKADGTEVTRAFLEIGEELWDGTGQRLTLLFDPGRVKQGLKPREEFGPVLITGESYRLVIDPAWRDANNQPLAAAFEKRFKAGPMVDSAVDAKKWKVEPPAAGSRDALSVTFDRPLDRALLMRMVSVADRQGKPIEGGISISHAERRWQFVPEQPWQSGEHALLADPALEDSAGNNLERAFEIDVFDRVDDSSRPAAVRIPFMVPSR